MMYTFNHFASRYTRICNRQRNLEARTRCMRHVRRLFWGASYNGLIADTNKNGAEVQLYASSIKYGKSHARLTVSDDMWKEI